MSSYSKAKAKHDAGGGDGEGDKLAGLMCAAHGCPNRWSIDMGNGRLCRFHDGAEKDYWPEITQAQQWAETERARLRGEAKPVAPPLSDVQKTRILNRARNVFAAMAEQKDPKAWACKLRDREQAGEALNERQRTAWRAAKIDEPVSEEETT